MLKILCALVALVVAPALAQGEAPQGSSSNIVGDAILATVNDEPISTFDVQQRVLLILATSGGQLPEGAEAQIRQKALRDLVEEQLKLQEAGRFDLVVAEDEIDEEVARIAASGGGTPEALAQDLAQQGIAIETLRKKIRAERAWERIVQGRFGGRVNVSSSEVQSFLDKLRADTRSDQFLISEICLPLDDPRQSEQVYNIGMQMIGQMRQGVPFQALAQQFSVCPSAARGGDLGWMRPAELDPAVAQLVSQLGEGNVSTPVEVDDMLKLLAVRSKREAAEQGERSYALAYAGVPKRRMGRAAAEQALAKLPLAAPCRGGSLNADLGSGVGVTLLPMLPVSDFEAPFRNRLLDLGRGDLSGVFESDTAFHRVLVCEIDEGLGLPPRRVVENRLQAQELDLIARRYLRDVERDSDVDIRVTASASEGEAVADGSAG